MSCSCFIVLRCSSRYGVVVQIKIKISNITTGSSMVRVASFVFLVVGFCVEVEVGGGTRFFLGGCLGAYAPPALLVDCAGI